MFLFQIILQLYQFCPTTFVSPVLEKTNQEKSTVSRTLLKHLIHILRKEVRCIKRNVNNKKKKINCRFIKADTYRYQCNYGNRKFINFVSSRE